jgi:hypothetical protein
MSTTDDPNFRAGLLPFDPLKHHYEQREREREADRRAYEMSQLGRDVRDPVWRDRSPKARDRRFANLLGFAVSAWLLWIGYSRGFGYGRIWDFVGPLIAGYLMATILARLTVIVRPLRWLATIGITLAVMVFLLQAFKAA